MTRQLALNVLEEELDVVAPFCRSEKLGIELTAFAYPEKLDRNFERRVERHAEAADGLTPVVVHGPFLDLYVTSPDPEIVRVCTERHETALSAAIRVGASVYVAHLNSVPLINNDSYRQRFVRAVADFWLPFADDAARHGITIVLENLWENSPDLQKRVVEEAGHPHLKASFDNGHALVFSDVRAKEWIEVLAGDLAHCHLHDNDGTYDHHWAVGQGVEDWTELFAAIQTRDAQPVVVLESDKLEVNKRSLAQIMNSSFLV